MQVRHQVGIFFHCIVIKSVLQNSARKTILLRQSEFILFHRLEMSGLLLLGLTLERTAGHFWLILLALREFLILHLHRPSPPTHCWMLQPRAPDPDNKCWSKPALVEKGWELHLIPFLTPLCWPHTSSHAILNLSHPSPVSHQTEEWDLDRWVCGPVLNGNASLPLM